MSFQKIATICTVVLSFLFLSGCASSAMKTRKEQQVKAAQSSKLYCEFINGELFPDVDVALNIEMAKRCDSEKHYTITSYKTPSENQGVLYCCSIARNTQLNTSGEKAQGKSATKAVDKKEEKKDDKKEEEEIE